MKQADEICFGDKLVEIFPFPLEDGTTIINVVIIRNMKRNRFGSNLGYTLKMSLISFEIFRCG
jgi:hypothetical protein